MIQSLLDNAVWLIALATVLLLANSEIKRLMNSNGMDKTAAKQYLDDVLKTLAVRVLKKFLTSIVVAFCISMISFRSLWLNDVFHVTFIASLLIPIVESSIRRSLQ